MTTSSATLRPVRRASHECHVAAGPGTRLLDLATGPGYVAARAAEHGAILKPNPRR
jgi:predicted methyltransferase